MSATEAELLNSALLDESLKRLDLMVLGVIMRFLGSQPRVWQSISYSELTSEAGVSRASVARAIAALCRAGYLCKQQGNVVDANRYRLPLEQAATPTALADGVVPDDECVRRLTAAMREADAIHRRVGGGTRHYVRDCLLPILDRHGITIAAAPSQPVKGGMSGWCRGEGCVHKAFGEPIWKTGDNPFMTAAQPTQQASGGGVVHAMDSVFVIEHQDGTPFYRDDAMGILATDSEAQAVRFQYAREEEGAVIARYKRDVTPWAHPDALPDRHAMHAAEAGEHGGENE